MLNRICIAVLLSAVAVAAVESRTTVWSGTMTVDSAGNGYSAIQEYGQLTDGRFTWNGVSLRVDAIYNFPGDSTGITLADGDCPVNVGSACATDLQTTTPFPFVLWVEGYGELDLQRSDEHPSGGFSFFRNLHFYEWRHGQSQPAWTWTPGETIRVSLFTEAAPTPALPLAGAVALAALLAAGGRRRLRAFLHGAAR